MKMHNLTELWILNDMGDVFFHYPQSITNENSGLLYQFLSGILKFMKDMGGNKEYLLSMGQKQIIGVEMQEIPEQLKPLYIVGAFVGKNKKDLKHINIMCTDMCELISKYPDLELNYEIFVKRVHHFL